MKRSLLKKIIGAVLLFGLIGVVSFAVMVFSAYRLFLKNQPRIQTEITELKEYLKHRPSSEGGTDEPAVGFSVDDNGDLIAPAAFHHAGLSPSRIYDRNGRVIGEFTRQDLKRLYELGQVPPYLVKALLVTEDRQFYDHRGYSLRGILRASLVNLMHLRTKQGASTLTQQLSKILFTTREKIYSRKLFELFCAVELEKKFSKDEILLLYLNFVYFGHGCYGVENASVGLFGKSASGLSVVEAAHLVSVLANPSIFSPRLNPELSKKRHEMVMNLLVKEGVVSSSFAKREWVRHWQDIQSGYLSSVTSIWGMSLNRAPYFVEQVRRQLDRLFPSEEVQEGGYSVYTSLDLDLQDIADAKLGEGLQNLNRLFPSTTSEGRVEGAVVVLDCESGDVLASIGGSAFGVYNQLLRTTQIHRPIGSLVKPLVAALAFEKGVTADQEIEDKPLKIKIPGRNWEPKNYDRQFLVKVTLEQALIASRNIPFINLLSDLGPKPLIELIQNGSDASKERLPRNLSIALGACELSPLEVARLYALFPRGGKVLIPVDVKLIQKENGEIIFDQRDVAGVNTAESAGLFSKETAGSVSEILAKVISEPNGTANAAAKQVGFDLKAYGKTGTTQSYRDAWFAGFTRSLVAVVWVGVDRNIALEGASGGRVAAPIWLKMIKAMGDR